VKRREFMMLAGCATAVWSLPTHAQPASGMRKVGMLMPPSNPDWVLRLGAFKKGLLELGWEEGKNFAFETRYVIGRPDQVSLAAAELPNWFDRFYEAHF